MCLGAQTHICTRLTGQAEPLGGRSEAFGVEPVEADHPTHNGPPTCQGVGSDYQIIQKYLHITLLINVVVYEFCDSNRPH